MEKIIKQIEDIMKQEYLDMEELSEEVAPFFRGKISGLAEAKMILEKYKGEANGL